MPVRFLGAASSAPREAHAVDELRSGRVCVLGYGSQARAHALNLRASGLDVAVAMDPEDPQRERAVRDRMPVVAPADGAREALLVAATVPRNQVRAAYDLVVDELAPGAALVVADAGPLDTGALVPRDDIDVIALSPKLPGPLLRRTYLAGIGVPVWIEIQRDATGRARARARAYAAGLGATEAGTFESVVLERHAAPEKSVILRPR